MGKRIYISLVVMLAFTLSLMVLPGTAVCGTMQTLGEFTFSVDKGSDEAAQDLTMSRSGLTRDSDADRQKNKGKKRSKNAIASKMFDDPNQCKAVGYSIQVINGNKKKKETVTSAKIMLNGKVLYRQKDFKKKFKSLSAPLDMDLIKANGNVLEVMVNGRPGSHITVGIYGEYSGNDTGGGSVPGAVYLDMDLDGYGSTMWTGSGEPTDYSVYGYDWVWVSNGGDCDEGDPLVNPSVAGTCPACW